MLSFDEKGITNSETPLIFPIKDHPSSSFTGKQPTSNKILVAQKSMHKGAMFGHVSNGGGMLSLGEGYGLQFIAKDDKFVMLQLSKHGINQAIQTQSWQKAKIVKKIVKKTVIKKVIQKKIVVKKPVQKTIETAIVSDKADVEEIL